MAKKEIGMNRSAHFRIACAMAVGLCAIDVKAHKLSPVATPEERRLSDIRGSWVAGLERTAASWGLQVFGEPVHEELTDRIYGCDGIACDGRAVLRAPSAVLAGVRWNDDPPFRLSSREGKRTRCKVTQTIRFQTQPYCWYQLFRDANARAAEGAVFSAEARSAMLYRTHFGDLQFLHAMASGDGVAATETERLVLDWAEFNWRIMLGEIDRGKRLKDIDNPTVQSRFGETEWYVQDLYTLGSPGLRSHLKDVAFGSILHTLQDSFSEGHVARASAVPTRTCSIGQSQMIAPGQIIEFHAYNHQDHDLHASSDTRGALEEHLLDEPDVVEIGRLLLGAYKTGRPWEDVDPFFRCIYALSEGARPSSAGENYMAIADPT